MGVRAEPFVGIGWIIKEDDSRYKRLLSLINPSSEEWNSVSNPDDYFYTRELATGGMVYLDRVIVVTNGYMDGSDIFLGMELDINNCLPSELAALETNGEIKAYSIYEAILEEDAPKPAKVRVFTEWC